MALGSLAGNMRDEWVKLVDDRNHPAGTVRLQANYRVCPHPFSPSLSRSLSLPPPLASLESKELISMTY